MTKMTRVEKKERRELVISEILSGKQQTETAKKHDLSLSYTMTILRNHCRERNYAAYTETLVPMFGNNKIYWCASIDKIRSKAEMFK